jgi:hypothetical protein
MHELDINDKREQRKFGLLMAAAFCIIALIRWWLKGHVPTVFFGIGAAFFIFGLVAPIVLKPVFYVWMRFAVLLNVVVTHVLLFVSFVLMIVPTRFIRVLFRSGDPLHRDMGPTHTTYWEAPERQPKDLSDYKNQF